MCDEVRKRRAHNERVNKQAEAWFKTKNHEFFLLITDSMIKTHPGLRDTLRDRCALGEEDKGYLLADESTALRTGGCRSLLV